MKRMACVLALAAGTGLALSVAANPAMGGTVLATSASGLQIAIGAAGVNSGSSAVTLDVNFHGGNIRTIELYVDGDLIKRQGLRTREGHGIISFALDNSLIPAGDHDILIKAFDADGGCATATRTVRVEASEAGSLTRFLGLKNHSDVKGVVPIQIKLDASVRSPYVTFLVDNEFKAMVNYAPFSYNWDTTRLTNGSHRIGVEVVDGESLATVQTLILELNVINVLGFTSRAGSTNDLGAPVTKTLAPIAKTLAPVAKTLVPIANAILDAAQEALPDAHVDAHDVPRSSIQRSLDFLLPQASQFSHSPEGRYSPLGVRASSRAKSTSDTNLNAPKAPLTEAFLIASYGISGPGLSRPNLDIFHGNFSGDRLGLDIRNATPSSGIDSDFTHSAVRPRIAGPQRDIKRTSVNSLPFTRMFVPASIAWAADPRTETAFSDPKLDAIRSLPDAILALSQMRYEYPSSEEKRSGEANPPKGIGNPTRERVAHPSTKQALNPGLPAALAALLSDPTDSTLKAIDEMSGHLARQGGRIRRPGSIARRPSLEYPGMVSGVVKLSTASHPGGTDAPLNRTVRRVRPSVAASPKAWVPMRVARLPLSGEHVAIRVKSFDVAFDNTRIAFDVQPRVEHGLPLAPFRQIFEHTGGEVKWYGKSQTVRAVNSTHEIQFRIGHSLAKVNNQSIRMDAKPYVDHGRAIVPLSFVRDAMDVKVNFDVHTGHLRIESNR